MDYENHHFEYQDKIHVLKSTIQQTFLSRFDMAQCDLHTNPLAGSLNKYSWIRTGENNERICLNKKKNFLNLAFGQIGEKH
jgi:hypothetical protein